MPEANRAVIELGYFFTRKLVEYCSGTGVLEKYEELSGMSASLIVS